MFGNGKEIYYVLKMVPGEETIVEEKEENIFSKKKKKKERFVTFIVFSSSETIISGRSDEAMREKYKEFIRIISKHRKEIED